MYHPNIIFASHYKNRNKESKCEMNNIESNPIIDVLEHYHQTIPDLVTSSRLPLHVQVEHEDIRVNEGIGLLTDIHEETNSPTENAEAPRKSLTVVDFRYFNDTPVYSETTLPLPKVSRTHTRVTLWHGILFSLIIIVGSVLGAMAGYGLYKASL